MATITVNRPDLFPPGTVVAARRTYHPGAPEAEQSPIESSATVGLNGRAELEGVADDVLYVFTGAGHFLYQRHEGDDGTEIAVQEVPFRVASFGARPGVDIDQAPMVQRAIDAAEAAGGGRVIFDSGLYVMRSPIVRPAEVPVDLVGQGARASQTAGGKNGTTLWWPEDHGRGFVAIDSRGSLNAQVRHCVEHLSWMAGALPVPLTFGQSATQMTGFKTMPYDVVRRCSTGGFREGIWVRSHHETFEFVNVSCSYYGFYWGDGDPNQGDQILLGCDAGGCFFAAVAVAPAEQCGPALFSKSHFGFSPYAFYKEDMGADARFMSSPFVTAAIFDACDFESVGHGFFFDESHKSYIGDTQFIGVGTFDVGESSYFRPLLHIAGRSTDYAIDVGALQNVTIDSPQLNPFASVGDKGIIRAKMVDNVRWGDLRGVVKNTRALEVQLLSDAVVVDGQPATLRVSDITDWVPFFGTGQLGLSGNQGVHPFHYEGLNIVDEDTFEILNVTGLPAGTYPTGMKVQRPAKLPITLLPDGFVQTSGGTFRGAPVRFMYAVMDIGYANLVTWAPPENVARGGFLRPVGVSLNEAKTYEVVLVQSGGNAEVLTHEELEVGTYVESEVGEDFVTTTGFAVPATDRTGEGVAGYVINVRKDGRQQVWLQGLA